VCVCACVRACVRACLRGDDVWDTLSREDIVCIDMIMYRSIITFYRENVLNWLFPCNILLLLFCLCYKCRIIIPRITLMFVITSQHGSAWHCYIGLLNSKGKMRFQPLGLEKPKNILEPNLAGMFMSVRSTNSPNVVQISCEMAPPHGSEI